MTELLRDADALRIAVVVLQLATPASVREDWPVAGRRNRGADAGKPCAPYPGWRWHGSVEQVLYAPKSAPFLRAGQHLAVGPAELHDLVELERLACVEGVSKSPIWERFAGITPQAGQRVVAVLQWSGPSGWLERMGGAWLDPKDLPKVAQVLPPPQTFAPADALRAEWLRLPPALPGARQEDRERLWLSLARIAAPGAPPLLPAELTTPTEALWLQKAAVAHTPLERVTALMFLNRLKSKLAWTALAGLTAKDAAQWPAELDITWPLQRASELAEMPADLADFAKELRRRFADPEREVALQWRRFLTGQSQQPGGQVHTRAGLLAVSEVWARATDAEKARGLAHCGPLKQAEALTFACLLHWAGPLADAPSGARLQAIRHGYWEGEEFDDLAAYFRAQQFLIRGAAQLDWPALRQLVELAALEQLPEIAQRAEPRDRSVLLRLAWSPEQPRWRQARALPVLRQLDPAGADALRDSLLTDPSPLVRAAAIEDLPAAPTVTHALVAGIAHDREADAAQALVAAVARWKLPKEQAHALLSPLLQAAAWTVRLQVWPALTALDPSTPWPTAPAPTAEQQQILKLAEQLQARGKPVRLRLDFASPAPGKTGRVLRQVVLRLDPQVAPINTANLLQLARKGFYDGRAVARVVPDFVVQMGSPFDTMDGGPGYHVPCEDHLAPYTAGSVGMALSGKDTGGSQFFVTLAPAPHLTGQYTRVGEVENLPQALKVLRDLGPGDVLVRVRER